MRNGTLISLTNQNSPKAKSSRYIKDVNRPPFEALKGGLPMSGMPLYGLLYKSLNLRNQVFP